MNLLFYQLFNYSVIHNCYFRTFAPEATTPFPVALVKQLKTSEESRDSVGRHTS